MDAVPYRKKGDGTLIAVRLRPGSSRRGIKGLEGGRLNVLVHSHPEKGKANRELLKVLAEALEMPPSSLELIKGHTSRNKTVLASGISPSDVKRRLGKEWGQPSNIK